MGTVYRASFSKQDEVDEEKNPEQKLIIKVAPLQSARREQFTARPSFLQEMYMYGTVSIMENKATILSEQQAFKVHLLTGFDTFSGI